MDRNRNQPCDKQLTSDLLAIEMQRLSLVRVATNPDSVTSTTSKRKPKKILFFTNLAHSQSKNFYIISETK